MEGLHEIDTILERIGPVSCFPVLQFFIYCLSYVWDAFQLFGYVFISQDVDHKCASPTNGSDVLIPELHDDWPHVAVHYGKCSITISRNNSGDVTTWEYGCLYGMEYEQPREMSILSQFDLVCERAPLAGLTQTLLSLGGGFGSAILPALSDKFGRCRCVVICMLLSVPCCIAAGVGDSYALHTAMKFIIGFMMPGIGVTAFTAGVELFPSSHRPLASCLGSGVWWCLCLTSVAPFAYALRFESWRTFQLATCVWGIFVILMIAFLSEPLRWLVANNKKEQALGVLKKAARWNRMKLEPILDAFYAAQTKGIVSAENVNVHAKRNSTVDSGSAEKISAEDTDKSKQCCNMCSRSMNAEKREAQVGFMDLFVHKRLRATTFISFFIYFIHSWIYFALMLMSASLAGSVYLNFFLNSVVEGVACAVAFLVLRRLQRRQTIAIFLGVTGLGLIASSVCLHFEREVNHMKTSATVFALLGKFGIGASYNTLFMYTPELFPTNIRNRAIGLTVVAATIGGMVAPFSGSLADVAMWLPGVIFGACSCLAAILLRYLPETMGRELPQTIADLEAWYIDDSSLSEVDEDSDCRKLKSPCLTRSDVS